MTGYELSREWFDFCFKNPDKVRPNHTALYFFAIEHCNRLGWKEKFGLPTEMAKEAIGIGSYNTYINTLRDLVEWKFIILIQKSQNQYSSNVISLVNFNKKGKNASSDALSNFDKALIKHGSKQSESTYQSIDSINKLITNNLEQINNHFDKFKEFVESLGKKNKFKFLDEIIQVFADEFEKEFMVEYTIIAPGKERQAASKILQYYKKKYPEANSDETIDGLREFFSQCVQINDEWLSKNMSLPIVVSQFNKIKNILKNGSKRKTDGSGASPEELANLVSGKLASDRPTA